MVIKSRTIKLFSDSISWIFAAWLATLLRFDGQLPILISTQIWLFSLFAATVSFFFGIIFSVYIGKYRSASLEEFLILSLSVGLSTLLLSSVCILFGFPQIPRSVPIVSGVFALIFMLAFRILANPRKSKFSVSQQKGERTLIYGAGVVGQHLVQQMLLQTDKYNPIGFLDDDKSIRNLKVFSRSILGSIDDLEMVVKKESAAILVVAIHGVNSANLLDLERRCRALGVSVRIIPSAIEIISGAIRLADITDISMEDLLGRRPISPDHAQIAEFLRGKRVLITGAGGSIGSEIARQVCQYGLSSLALVDRDETALLNLQLSLTGKGLLTEDGLILGDIRDNERVAEIFSQTRPEVVFHAAALKHLTTLERFPSEAHKTNVIGTMHVINAAIKCEVQTFINISTDKAADPTSALGRSKLTTERLVAAVKDEGKKYISVRFGNVIGSNGSFIHTFRHQIQNGGPVTVTHPDVTRYFMTVSEAVHLVLQSIIFGRSGETLILDMGQPVSIESIAKHMIEVSGRKVDIVYSGLRDGEKLHETLNSLNEEIEIRENPLIMHTRVEPLDGLETF